MRFQLNQKLLLLICAAGVALSIGVIALLFQLDGLVNVSLYDYGLLFDIEWATPYWAFLRLALGLLGFIAGLNVLSILYIALSRKTPLQQEAIRISQKPTVMPQTPSLRNHHREKEMEREKMHVKEEDGIEVAALPMVCNKCGKVFTQPLCMFDFKSGKPRLVNVCPYCNAVLAVSGNSGTE